MKAKREALLQRNLRLEEQAAGGRKEFLDLKKRTELMEQELRAAILDADNLPTQLESAEDELAQARIQLLKRSWR